MTKSAAAEKIVGAGEFKTKCLGLIDEVHSKRRPITITKRGKPVARLVPVLIQEDEKDTIFGFFKGKGRIVGDIVSPIITPDEWGDLY